MHGTEDKVISLNAGFKWAARRVSYGHSAVSGEDVGLELEVVLGRGVGKADALELGGLAGVGDESADARLGEEIVTPVSERGCTPSSKNIHSWLSGASAAVSGERPRCRYRHRGRKSHGRAGKVFYDIDTDVPLYYENQDHSGSVPAGSLDVLE